MAAESVGLAASVAGLVSLGLQIAGGIIKYVDAFENRQEELSFVKRESEVLKTVLLEVDAQLGSHGQSRNGPDAVVQSMTLFKEELSHVQALYTNLADSDPQRWTARLENKKNATYAFNRVKIQELGLRLQKAGDALQLTLNVLSLQVLKNHSDTLAAVGSSAQGISSEVSLVRSELASIESPLVKINDQLSLLQGGVDSNSQLLVSQHEALSIQLQVRSNDILRNVQETTDTVHHLAQLQSRHEEKMTKRYEEMTKNFGQILEHLQQSHVQIPAGEAVVCGPAGKPALLKKLSDEVQSSRQMHDQLVTADRCTPLSQKTFGSPIRHSTSRPVMGRVCTCPRLQSAIRSKWIQLGHASFSSERETIAHWPSCPMAKMSMKTRMTIGFRYSGLVRILKTAVNVSFAMTSGAGGFSISPNFTCSPTVDDDFDPAFCIVTLIGDWVFCLQKKNPELFIMACIRRLIRLLDDRKVCAIAVDSQNMTLMHHTILALGEAQPAYYRDKSRGIIWVLFVELVQTLLSYGVAAFTFDLKGKSPLVNLSASLFDYDVSQAVTEILIQANSENRPLVLDMFQIESEYEFSQSSIPTISRKLLHKFSSGFAEVSACGPLSMAIIQDDANGVEHMLNRTPAAIAEIDVFGQTPFHLAAANPPILEILLRYGNRSILDRRDMSGFTALETAMIHTSDYCDNGLGTDECDDKECDCSLCVDLLIGAECDVRMHKLAKSDRAPELHLFLTQASELARRKYVGHMKRRLNSTMRIPSPSAHASTSLRSFGLATESEIQQIERNTAGSSQQREYSPTPDLADDTSWVFPEIDDPHLGALFYHHGFQPGPSFLNHLVPDRSSQRGTMNYSYLHWLVSHAVDPFLRSSKGPALTEDSPNIGLFGAHFAFYFISLWLTAVPPNKITTLDPGSWDAYMALTATVCRQSLTDGCKCYCTIGGCSPYTWMMKGAHLVSLQGRGYAQVRDSDVDILVSHYSRCGVELTSLTYTAAIRYATFGALGLVHTCCNAYYVTHYGDNLVKRDDVDIINEEQAPLLETLEALVEEFEERAIEFMKTDLSGNSLFPQFWVLYWKVRMNEELEKLEGNKLTDAERLGAEAIGVRWAHSQWEAETGNPYSEEDPEYWFYELDKICPEYVEPWPEGLRRVSEMP